jgi:LuxR family maltose regulon positive regulatory protein
MQERSGSREADWKYKIPQGTWLSSLKYSMSIPLLLTKLFIPQPRKTLVVREQLFDKLNAGRHNKLILVSAPAGYGKTTLISSWLACKKLTAAWVSADSGDNDYYRFLRYLLAALRQIDAQFGGTLLQMLQSPMPPSVDNCAELFLNELSSLSEEYMLVVDDYQLIDNPAIHATFRQIIEGSPKELHFIICTRTELPFSVSRLRSKDELLELTQRDLSLTLGESARYMNLVMGLGLQPEEIAILQDRTEGWLVGLQLVALSLRDQMDPTDFVRSLKGDNRYIADYLVDEVLLRIPMDLQDFLLRSSILNRMEASLCNFVLQIENSQELLESVDKKRLFIIPLDDKRRWFRHHHLFGEMLYARLARKSPEIMAGLYHRASAWHDRKGMKEEAVDYALEGKDYDQVAALLQEIGPNLLSHGNWNQLLGWYERIPEAEFLSRHDLWFNYLLSVLNAGLIPAGEKRINILKAQDLELRQISPEELARVKGELAATQGVFAIHGKVDPARARESLKFGYECLAKDEFYRSGYALFNYGVSYFLLGEVEEARNIFIESLVGFKENDLPLGKVMGTSYLAETTAMTGNLRMAQELFQTAVRYAHEAGLQQGAVYSKTNLGLGKLFYEWNDLDQALHYLTEGIRLAECGGYLDQLLFGYADLVHLQLLQQDLLGVQRTIHRARKMAEKYDDPPAAVSFINGMESLTAQQRGSLFIVDNWLNSCRNASLSRDILLSQYEHVALARALIAREEYCAACEVLKPVRELALQQSRVRDLISFNVITAKCLFMKGEPLPAITILQKALVAAEPSRFVRSFLDEGGVVISMIKQLLASKADRAPNAEECSADYLYFLLDQVASDTVKVSTSHPLPSSTEGLEPLTDHELHILRLVEAGHSNKQIAQELNISLNTVKYHLKNIYGKLGVVNRTQAARTIRNEL